MLLNLINHESNTDKIYLCAKDPHEAKYQLLINNRETASLKYSNDLTGFAEYVNKKRKIVIVFDDMIVDMLCNKKKLIQ